MLHRIHNKSRAEGELGYLRNMAECKQQNVVTSHVILMSRVGILYLQQAVTFLHSTQSLAKRFGDVPRCHDNEWATCSEIVWGGGR
jgi:hypothetical protein